MLASVIVCLIVVGLTSPAFSVNVYQNTKSSPTVQISFDTLISGLEAGTCGPELPALAKAMKWISVAVPITHGIFLLFGLIRWLCVQSLKGRRDLTCAMRVIVIFALLLTLSVSAISVAVLLAPCGITSLNSLGAQGVMPSVFCGLSYAASVLTIVYMSIELCCTTVVEENGGAAANADPHNPNVAHGNNRTRAVRVGLFANMTNSGGLGMPAMPNYPSAAATIYPAAAPSLYGHAPQYAAAFPPPPLVPNLATGLPPPIAFPEYHAPAAALAVMPAPTAAPAAATATVAARKQPAPRNPLDVGLDATWTYDDASDLWWSDSHKLFYSAEHSEYYDPEREVWTVGGEWE